MFEKCIPCARKGVNCVPNLWLLPLPELLQWCIKTQKYIGWSNQTWADKSNIPVGTINRLKAGEYADCKYSTIRSLALALIGGTQDEFSCTDQVEKELRQMERLEQQAAKLEATEAENALLKKRLAEIDELHRKDIHIIKEEFEEQKKDYKERIAFLKEELKAWQARG